MEIQTVEPVEQVFTVTEAAKYSGHHVNTIRRWIHDGDLKASRIKPKGHFRIRKSDLDKANNPTQSDS